MSEENKRVVRRYFEELDRGRATPGYGESGRRLELQALTKCS